MGESKSAQYQRAFRERMRRQGLVSKLVYVRPEYAALLTRVEKALQRPGAQVTVKANHTGESEDMGTTQWTTSSLYEALKASPLVTEGRAAAELIGGVDPVISLTMRDYGDLTIQIIATGQQLMCSTTLCEASQVKNVATFNEELLLLNPVYPLSNFGLFQLEDGRKVYEVFGELSTSSLLTHVLEELEMLAQNTLEAAEAFAPQLKN